MSVIIIYSFNIIIALAHVWKQAKKGEKVRENKSSPTLLLISCQFFQITWASQLWILIDKHLFG